MAATVAPCVCGKLRAKGKLLKRLKRDGDAAAAVYNDTLPPDSPLREATDEELAHYNLNRAYMEHLTDQDGNPTGFRARMYIDKATGEKLVAFRGTTSADGDIAADWQQAVGLPNTYYSRAQNISSRIEAAGGDDVRYVGHSLGGGLASAASRISGNPASTFNAAGLNPLTILRGDSMNFGGQIDAVHVEGEVLTSAQQALPIPEASATQDIALQPPEGFGAELLSKVKNWEILGAAKALAMRRLDLHRMSNVQKSIDQTIARNDAAIKANNC